MNILIKPVITEKMNKLTEKLNRYGFVVARGANKLQIKEAVEKTYGVTVEAVNTQNYIGKFKSRNTKNGIVSGIANRHRKAVVTLKKGESIDLYSNI
ncbi:MAG: 50S ribosomal protein L23 [Bacteroidota bacterium]|jgi:large subunit ribosomal protein L23